jgi:hypothetical protein
MRQQALKARPRRRRLPPDLDPRIRGLITDVLQGPPPPVCDRMVSERCSVPSRVDNGHQSLSGCQRNRVQANRAVAKRPAALDLPHMLMKKDSDFNRQRGR